MGVRVFHFHMTDKTEETQINVQTDIFGDVIQYADM